MGGLRAPALYHGDILGFEGLSDARFEHRRGMRRGGRPRVISAYLVASFGGVLGPVALMFGLTRTSGATASLMLNLEAVLTALLAWLVFRENADRRMVWGMIAIITGGIVLAWPSEAMQVHDWRGPLAVSLACLCWAIDNILIRKVSASDALSVAGFTGLIAGLVNCSLALLLGSRLPEFSDAAYITGATLNVDGGQNS